MVLWSARDQPSIGTNGLIDACPRLICTSLADRPITVARCQRVGTLWGKETVPAAHP